jgi:cytochrome c-type biogenesis protein CcmE
MKKTSIILLVVIAICVSGMVMLVGDFSTYETFETAQSKSGKEIKVIGALDSTKAVIYDPLEDANFFSFHMIDKAGDVRKVVFNGTKPTDFEKSTELVLTGKMQDDTFVCSQILMKCPSKYKDEQLVNSVAEKM